MQGGASWWEAGPELVRCINMRISGSPQENWLEYTLRKYFTGRLPLGRCLSLGCGSGHLERALCRLGAFQDCQAFDIASASIYAAQKFAQNEGFDSIHYSVADINTLNLPGENYDAAWVYDALHHFENLEHVSQQIRYSLKPGGLLIFNEYIGPNRFQFPERQKELVNLCLGLLPEPYRRVVSGTLTAQLDRSLTRKGYRWFLTRLVNKIRDGDLLKAVQRRWLAFYHRQRRRRPVKQSVRFPSILDVTALDPSEAVRSQEIIPVFSRDFEIVEKKDWGGNILQFLLEDIAGNFADGSAQSAALLHMLSEIEAALIQVGEFNSDFAYIVMRPK